MLRLIYQILGGIKLTNKLFTTKEIMELLGLAQPTISKYVKKGMPVAGKVDFGKGNVYNLKDVTDWIKDNTKPAGRPKKCDECMVDDLPFTEEECAEIIYDFGDFLYEEAKKKELLEEKIEKEYRADLEELDKNHKPYSYVKPKVFKHRDMPVYVREDLHDKVKREALRHNVTMKKLVEDIVAYHLEIK